MNFGREAWAGAVRTVARPPHTPRRADHRPTGDAASAPSDDRTPEHGASLTSARSEPLRRAYRREARRRNRSRSGDRHSRAPGGHPLGGPHRAKSDARSQVATCEPWIGTGTCFRCFSTSRRFRARRGRSGLSPTACSSTSGARPGGRRGRRRAEVGSPIGNILCAGRAFRRGRHPIFLCAHLDTVPLEGRSSPWSRGRRRPERRGDDPRRRQQGGGRRDARGDARACSATASARRDRAPLHAEGGGGLRGANAFDRRAARGAVGYVYDQAAPIGEVILGAPHMRKPRRRYHGRATHAGMYPEEGRSAIAAAARAIADLRLGRDRRGDDRERRRDQGGAARNIVPEHCRFHAEARSHDEREAADLVQEMLDTFTFAAEASRVRGRGRRLEGYGARLPLPPRRPGRSRSPRPRSSERAASRASSSPAAAPTPTSSTSRASSASTSRTQ